MSHVTTVEIEINDLDCLKRAAENCGLELREGQKTYKWYGMHAGDYPLPEGFTEESLGKCEHALSVPGKPGAYEIGVANNPNGNGYTLLYDFWSGGKGLMKHVSTDGKTCDKLVQGYATQVAKKQLRRMGKRVTETVNEQGEVVLLAR